MSHGKIFVVLVCQTLHVSMAMQCTQCAPGKFKSQNMFFSPCTPCLHNTFSAAPGAASCDACPPFSASAAGSSRCTFEPCRSQNYSTGCVCPVGTTGPDSGPCDACAAGTYKNATGDAQCNNCSSTKTSVAGSVSCFCQANYITTDVGDCLPCMNGMISRENSAVCFCPNGTTTVEGNCVQIYSEGLRLSGFISIPESNSTNTSSSTDLDTLMQELIRSIALQYNISEDLVQVIFTTTSRNLLNEHGLRVDIIIMATSAETFAAVANTTIELPLLQEVVRTFLPISLNEGTIVLCGNNEISIATACVCSRRYTRSAGTCSKCAPGTSKATDGDEACGKCSGDTFSGIGDAQCSACPLSATTRKNHTTCACNTGFVFFRGVCTQTKDVYMNVSGILQMPYGDFLASQLQAILLEGMSTYLNFSREFITIIVTPPIEIINTTGTGGINTTDANETNDTNTTGTEGINTTDANETNDTMPADGSWDVSNSTQSGRRLLFALPVDYYFIALFQIEIGDEEAYAKIRQYLNDTQYGATTMTDSNGYRIVPRRAELLPGYFSADGSVLESCADGRAYIFDSVTETLQCPVDIVPAPEQVKPKNEDMPAWQLALAIVLPLLAVLIAIYVTPGIAQNPFNRRSEKEALLPKSSVVYPLTFKTQATVPVLTSAYPPLNFKNSRQ